MNKFGKVLLCWMVLAWPALADTIDDSAVAKNFLEQYRASKNQASPTSAFSSPSDSSRDLEWRQPDSLRDVLATAPGVVVLRRAPGAEADSLLWRGVNSPYGSETASYVDGVPQNLPTFRQHGYADLHWVIPELVDHVDAFPGPYFASFGDFDTAGAIRLTTKKTMPANEALLGSGLNSQIRGLVISSLPHSNWAPLVAGEFYSTGAPSPSPDSMKRYNLFAKTTHALSGKSEFNLSVSAYGTDWDSAGLIANRAAVPWRGTLAGGQGGNMQRYAVAGNLRTELSRDSYLMLTGFAERANANVSSDSTLFLHNPASGDLSSDVEHETMAGFELKYRNNQQSTELGFDSELGLQTSADWGNSATTSPIGSVAATSGQRVGAYGQQRISWGTWLQTLAGIRADYVGESIDSTSQGVFQASPKAGLIILPTKKTQIFTNIGAGYHSNDPRALKQDPSVGVVTRVTGFELGARTQFVGGAVHVSASGFALTEDPTAIYTVETNSTQTIGQSTRVGLQAQTRVDITPWLLADFDITITRPRLTNAPDGNNAVPLAPTKTWSMGLTARHPKGYYGRLSLLNVGDRPASSDRFFTAEGFARLDASVGYKTNDFQLALGVINLTNTKWKETQTVGVSRLANETSCPAGTRAAGGGCEDILFTPGDPLTVQASATVFF